MEICVVVTIIGIMVSISIPTYDYHRKKTIRNEAKEALKELVSEQERYYLRYDRYAESINSEMEFTLASNNRSLENNYLLSIQPLTEGICRDRRYCYLLEARADSAISRTDDDCNIFYLTSTGTASSLSVSQEDSSDICW